MSTSEVAKNETKKTEIVLPQVTNAMSVIDVAVVMAYKCPTWAPTVTKSIEELKIISDCLAKRITTEGHFFPHNDRLFNTFYRVPLNKVRVVIIGQDPYPKLLSSGRPRAQGSSFSVSMEDEVPASLKNMYKEIKSSYPEWPIPNHGDLSKWEDSGVLLLNICLTCPPENAGGHAKYMLWLPFISKVLEAISAVRPNCIYMLWGKEALKISKFIGDKAHRLISSHPSPLSAYHGFIGCGHFKKADDLLKSFGEPPIQW
jgi:uracil-DNA glycosylase